MSENEKARAGNTGHEQGNDLSVHKIADQQQNINNSTTNSPSISVEKKVSKVVKLPKRKAFDDFRQENRQFIDDLKRHVNMEQWVNYIGFRVNGTSRNYECPFHSERTGSFHVYTDGSYCYGQCDRQYDHLEFAMQYKGWSFKQALENLASYAGKDLPWATRKTRARVKVKGNGSSVVAKPLSSPEPVKEYGDNTEYTDEEIRNYYNKSGWHFLREHDYPRNNPVYRRVAYETHEGGKRKKKFNPWTRTENGKWLNGQRVDPMLYRQEDLIAESDLERLVTYEEGEKDGDMAVELGYLGVTAGSATAFTRHASRFVPLFKDRNVVIFLHNDDTGKTKLKEVAILLHAVATSVKLIELPVAGKGEDLYNFVMDEKYHNGDKEAAKIHLQQIIDETEVFIPPKQEENEETDEGFTDAQRLQQICGTDYTPVLPANIKLTNNGLLAEVVVRKDNAIINILSKAFVIDGFVCDLRSNDTLLRLKSDTGETVIDADITNKSFSKVMTAFLHQPLDTGKLRALQRYVSDLKLLNPVIKDLKGRSQTGWEEKGDKYHIPLVPCDDGTVWMDPFHIQAYKTGGDKEKQYSLLKRILKTKAGIVVLAALTATINYRTGASNAVVNIHGMNANGKSTAVRFAMSLLGDYREQKLTWFATRAGLEQRLASMLHVPIWIEERETGSADSSDLPNFVYQFLEEVGKLRGNKDNMARTISKLNGVVITTAEKDLETSLSIIRKKSGGKLGMYRRVFEIDADKGDIYDLPDNSKIDMTEINEIAKENYGWFGMEWVTYIMANINVIKENYRYYLSKLKRVNLHGMDSLFASMIAVMEVLYDMGIINDSDTEVLGKHILDNIKDTESRINEKRDIAEEFIENLGGWVHKNWEQFIQDMDGDEDITIPDNVKKIAGIVIKNRDVFVTSWAIKEFLNDMNYVPRQLWYRLEQKGLLKVNTNSSEGVKRYGFRKSLNNHKLGGYYIRKVLSGGPDDTEKGSQNE